MGGRGTKGLQQSTHHGSERLGQDGLECVHGWGQGAGLGSRGGKGAADRTQAGAEHRASERFVRGGSTAGLPWSGWRKRVGEWVECVGGWVCGGVLVSE